MQALSWADNVSLAGRNTLHIAARAAAMCDVRDPSRIGEAFDLAAMKGLEVLVLGEGSNVLFAADYPGLVLCLTGDDCRIMEQNDSQALIRAEASGRRVLVLGHNSGISEAAAALVATRPKHRGFLEFPTCATLISDVSAPRWSALGEGMLTPCHFAVPREVLAAEAALQGKN